MITYFQEKDIIIEELIKVTNKFAINDCSAIMLVSVYYPTLDRNNLLTQKYVNDMSRVLQKVLSEKLVWQVFEDSKDGPMVFMGLKEEADKLKKTMAYLEDNHILGRWMVIEVLDNESNTIITREKIGLPERRCCICGCSLKECYENGKHSTFDVIREINRSYVEYMEGIE